jgi:hypothetical protein
VPSAPKFWTTVQKMRVFLKFVTNWYIDTCALKGAKTPLFSMFLALKVGLSAQPKTPSCFY